MLISALSVPKAGPGLATPCTASFGKYCSLVCRTTGLIIIIAATAYALAKTRGMGTGTRPTWLGFYPHALFAGKTRGPVSALTRLEQGSRYPRGTGFKNVCRAGSRIRNKFVRRRADVGNTCRANKVEFESKITPGELEFIIYISLIRQDLKIK